MYSWSLAHYQKFNSKRENQTCDAHLQISGKTRGLSLKTLDFPETTRKVWGSKQRSARAGFGIAKMEILVKEFWLPFTYQQPYPMKNNNGIGWYLDDNEKSIRKLWFYGQFIAIKKRFFSSNENEQDGWTGWTSQRGSSNIMNHEVSGSGSGPICRPRGQQESPDRPTRRVLAKMSRKIEKNGKQAEMSCHTEKIEICECRYDRSLESVITATKVIATMGGREWVIEKLQRSISTGGLEICIFAATITSQENVWKMVQLNITTTFIERPRQSAKKWTVRRPAATPPPFCWSRWSAQPGSLTTRWRSPSAHRDLQIDGQKAAEMPYKGALLETHSGKNIRTSLCLPKYHDKYDTCQDELSPVSHLHACCSKQVKLMNLKQWLSSDSLKSLKN